MEQPVGSLTKLPSVHQPLAEHNGDKYHYPRRIDRVIFTSPLSSSNGSWRAGEASGHAPFHAYLWNSLAQWLPLLLSLALYRYRRRLWSSCCFFFFFLPLPVSYCTHSFSFKTESHTPRSSLPGVSSCCSYCCFTPVLVLCSPCSRGHERWWWKNWMDWLIRFTGTWKPASKGSLKLCYHAIPA